MLIRTKVRRRPFLGKKLSNFLNKLKNSNILRRKIEDVSDLTKDEPTYIVGNLLWKIVCKKKGVGLFTIPG